MIKWKTAAFLLCVFLSSCGGGSPPAPPRELPSAFSQSVKIVPASGDFFYVVTFLEENNASVSQFLVDEDESDSSDLIQKTSLSGKSATLVETVTVAYTQSNGVINAETSFSNGEDFSATFSLDDNAAITAVDLEINGKPVDASFEVTLASSIVESTSPASDATGVSLSATIEINFAAEMDCNTLTASSVNLTRTVVGDDNESVAGTVTCSDDSRQVTFTPEDDLVPNEEHCLSLSTDVQDARDNALATSYEFCFTTKCASSEYFNRSEDLSCFTLLKITSTEAEEETLPGSFLDSATVANGNLTLDHNTTNSDIDGAGGVLLMKQLAPGDFSVELLIAGGMPANNTDEGIALSISSGDDADTNDCAMLHYHWPSTEEGVILDAASCINGEDSTPTSISLETDTLYLRLSRSGTTITYSYKTSSTANYTDLTTENRTTAGDMLGADTEPLYVGIWTQTGNTLGTFAPVIDHFIFLTGSAEGQE